MFGSNPFGSGEFGSGTLGSNPFGSQAAFGQLSPGRKVRPSREKQVPTVTSKQLPSAQHAPGVLGSGMFGPGTFGPGGPFGSSQAELGQPVAGPTKEPPPLVHELESVTMQPIVGRQHAPGEAVPP